jgi:hypothetical protein
MSVDKIFACLGLESRQKRETFFKGLIIKISNQEGYIGNCTPNLRENKNIFDFLHEEFGIINLY